MNKESLDMPEKPGKRSGASRLPVLIAVVVLGVAGWSMFSGDDAPEFVDSARRQIENTLGRNGSGQSESGSGGETLPVQDVSPGQEGAGTGVPGENGGAAQAGSGDGALPVPSIASTSGNVVEPPAGYDPQAVAPSPALPGMPGQPGAEAMGNGQGGGSGQAGTNGVNGAGVGEGPDGSPDAIDRAIAGESSSSLALTPAERAALTIMAGSVQDNEAPVEASQRQDSVVTRDFISNVARWLVSNYQPGSGGRSGRSAVTLMSANMRYGAGLTGLRHSASVPPRGREEILNYAFTPGMIDALHRLYGEALIEAMDQSALEKSVNSKGPLTVQQEADMFNVYAGLFRQLSASLRGAAATDNLRTLVEDVRAAGDGVVQASAVFAEILFAYEEARESDDKALEERLRLQMIEASKNSEMALESRTRARSNLTNTITRNAGGPVAGGESLVYLAEWLDRRGEIAQVAPAANMAAESSARLADQMAARAVKLLAEQ